jgi:hypothetical protein
MEVLKFKHNLFYKLNLGGQRYCVQHVFVYRIRFEYVKGTIFQSIVYKV